MEGRDVSGRKGRRPEESKSRTARPKHERRPDEPKARAARVAHALREALTEAIAADIRDPRVHAPAMLTVTRVELNVDMAVAHCYVSVVGDDATADAALEGLAKAAGFLRGPIGRRLQLQHAPGITKLVHRFEAAGNIVGQQADGAGRRDRSEVAVAQAMARDVIPNVAWQGPDKFSLRIFFPIEERKRTLFLGEPD
jgi:ribosome-binding factor A